MTRALVTAAAVLIALAGCKDRNEGISAEAYARVAEAEKQATATLPPPPEDVMPQSTAEYLGLFEAKGLHLGMTDSDVVSAIETRGMVLAPSTTGGPILEVSARLPRHAKAATAFVGTGDCRDQLVARETMSAEERNSIAGMRLSACKVAARIFYDDSGLVVGFYITPAGFDLDRPDVRQFATAVVDNLPIHELQPETESIRTLGQSGLCTNYVGNAPGGERVKVTDCAIMRMQVEESASSAGNFQ